MTQARVARRGLALLLAVCPLLLGACTAGPAPAPDPKEPSPFASCAALTAPPPSAAPQPPAAPPPAAPASASGGTGLPNITLPCFTGGAAVSLAGLRGPAVVNLWASWCEPCRDELPVMQRLADRAAGRLHVLGVDSMDDRDNAASFGTAKKVTMPTLFDRNATLLNRVGRGSLPLTIFIDAAGRDYVHPTPLDAAELSRLVQTHVGVRVTL